MLKDFSHRTLVFHYSVQEKYVLEYLKAVCDEHAACTNINVWHIEGPILRVPIVPFVFYIM